MRGVKKGSRVAVSLGNNLEFATVRVQHRSSILALCVGNTPAVAGDADGCDSSHTLFSNLARS